MKDRETPAGWLSIPDGGPLRSGGLLAGPARVDVYVTRPLDLDFFLADVAGDVLRVLDDALAYLDLLGDDRVLADVNLLLADRDADLLALAE